MLFLPKKDGHFTNCPQGKSCACDERGYILVGGVALLVFLFEIMGGILSRSQSLYGDAFHVLSDAGVYGLAFLVSRFRKRKFSSAAGRIESLTGLLVALIGALLVAYNATELATVRASIRVDPFEMLLVGSLGALANLWMVVLLHRLSIETDGHVHTKSKRFAIIHTMGDLIGSFGIIASAAGIFVGLLPHWSDRVVAIGIGGWLIFQVLRTSHESHRHTGKD
jgi:Co/Zn/Cd efflux system component